jgi:hypothetical protein
VILIDYEQGFYSDYDAAECDYDYDYDADDWVYD